MQDRLDRGMHPRGMRDLADLHERFEGLDRLFEEIKEHGYRTAEQRLGPRDWQHGIGEITVRIGRDRTLLLD